MIAGEPCFQRRSVPASGGAADRKRGGTDNWGGQEQTQRGCLYRRLIDSYRHNRLAQHNRLVTGSAKAHEKDIIEVTQGPWAAGRQGWQNSLLPQRGPCGMQATWVPPKPTNYLAPVPLSIGRVHSSGEFARHIIAVLQMAVWVSCRPVSSPKNSFQFSECLVTYIFLRQGLM